MKRTLLAFLICLCILSACKEECIQDSGNHIEKSLSVKPFNKIEVAGSIKLIIVQDSTYQLRIEADSNVLKYIKADVSGQELKLDLKEGIYCGSDSILVYAGIGELTGIKTEGAVKIVSSEPVYAKDVNLDFSGACDVDLAINAAKLVTSLDGSSKLSLRGQVGSHELTTKGTAEVDAFDFIAGIYKISIKGSAKANINVLNELHVDTKGTSEVYYKGNPSQVKEKKSGAVKLQKVN